MPTLKELRQEAGMSARQLEQASGVGIRTIFRAEAGRQSINYSTAMKLLTALGEKLGRTIFISEVDDLRVQ